jgi:hypothetical protein
MLGMWYTQQKKKCISGFGHKTIIIIIIIIIIYLSAGGLLPGGSGYYAYT